MGKQDHIDPNSPLNLLNHEAGPRSTQEAYCVRANSRWLRERLRHLGYGVPDGESPLVHVNIGSAAVASAAQQRLLDGGIYAERNYGVLTISLSVLHSPSHMESLVRAFANLRGYLKLVRNPLVGPAVVTWNVLKSKWQGAR